MKTFKEKLEKRNNRVRFDEVEHKYYVDGVKIENSVTQLIHHYFEEFNADLIARKMLKGDNFYSDETKYGKYWPLLKEIDDFETKVQIIKKSWEENGNTQSALGTKMHATIEDYINGVGELYDCPELNYFKAFHEEMSSDGYIPYKTEQIVWDKDYNLAGSADMLYTRKEWLVNLPIKVYLVDWKRSKEIKTTSFGGKTGRGPCAKIKDCNYEHYTLQLNVYQHLLEKHYYLEVVKKSIVVFHPDNDGYLKYNVRDKAKTARRICRKVDYDS